MFAPKCDMEKKGETISSTNNLPPREAVKPNNGGNDHEWVLIDCEDWGEMAE